MSSAAWSRSSFGLPASPLSSSQSGRAMAKATGSSTQGGGFDPARLRDFLRRRFPHDTAKEAGAALKISPRTIENWLNSRSRPDFEACGKLIGTFGAGFVAAVMVRPPDWAVDAQAREEFADLERRREALLAQLQQPFHG